MRDERRCDWLAPRDELLRNAWTDRDMSWLEFNRRVLHEAQDPRTPLLERVKFLAIFSSNLDEFYMKRVGSLHGLPTAPIEDESLIGDAKTRLTRIRAAVVDLLAQQAACFRELCGELSRHRIVLAEWEDLTAAQRAEASAHFDANVSPALTPLGFDPAHPFPFISNLSTNWGFVLRAPGTEDRLPVRVKSPTELPQWMPLTVDVAPGERKFVSLEALIRNNAAKLFPGMEIVSATLFRILRNADVELGHVETVPEAVIGALRERRFQPVVRIDFAPGAAAEIRRALVERFALDEQDVYDVDGLVDYTDLFQIAALDIPELRDPPFTSSVPPELREPQRSIFDVIRERDVLVHHPFDSFPATVERFLQSAATDEHVLAIKLTLYRTSGDTAIVRALTEAAERGKQVAVLIELKARGDEANNITWARTLEDYGVHVSYGSAMLKTHTKTAMVVRREPDGIRRYVHIGSGNYNSRTARLYTDIGLFTCSPSIGADVSDLFNSLTGISRQRLYRKLLVAPANMRERFIELIDRESQHALAGRPGRIVGKMNALVDPDVIDALYRASKAGVEIDLIVRGICCLRPGIAAVSERIRVMSIIGRFLEHSRIWHFGNGGRDEYYIGSADWMPRNFVRRVEAVAPVEAPPLQARLRALLETCLEDNRQAWELRADGEWVQRKPRGEVRSTHIQLLADSWGRSPDAVSRESVVSTETPTRHASSD